MVVPAVYSNIMFGWEITSESGDRMRLLPLSTFVTPLHETHGWDGADYYSSAPFRSSKPLRVILVACDTYHRSDFAQSVRRIQGRFVDAGPWTMMPPDPQHEVELWFADLHPRSEIAPKPGG